MQIFNLELRPEIHTQVTMPATICFICKNNNRLSSYFAFPLDQARKQEWCKLLAVDIRTISKRSVVCDQHFNSQQFNNIHRLRLRKNALPFRFSTIQSPAVSVLLPVPGILPLTPGPGVQVDPAAITLQPKVSMSYSLLSAYCDMRIEWWKQCSPKLIMYFLVYRLTQLHQPTTQKRQMTNIPRA